MTEDVNYHILRYVDSSTILPTVVERIVGSYTQQIYRIGMYTMREDIHHQIIVTSHSSIHKRQILQVIQQDGHNKTHNKIKIGSGTNKVTKITKIIKITSGARTNKITKIIKITSGARTNKVTKIIKITSGTKKVTKITKTTKITSGTALLF